MQKPWACFGLADYDSGRSSSDPALTPETLKYFPALELNLFIVYFDRCSTKTCTNEDISTCTEILNGLSFL